MMEIMMKDDVHSGGGGCGCGGDDDDDARIRR